MIKKLLFLNLRIICLYKNGLDYERESLFTTAMNIFIISNKYLSLSKNTAKAMLARQLEKYFLS
jgi:hypothetical protein